MKFKWNGYFEPTPPNIKKVGLAFKAVASGVVPCSLLGNHNIGLTLFFIGAIGNFLCGFFVEDPTQ